MLFLLYQSLRKNFESCGLDKIEFTANTNIEDIIKALKCLAFVDSLELDEAYSQLKDRYLNRLSGESLKG